jgi:hypothetical protein
LSPFDKVHEHQHHALEKGFVHGTDNGSSLTTTHPFFLPTLADLNDDLFQSLRHTPQGAR